MSFIELVKKARSIRRFKEHERIREDELRELIEVVRFVPCGGNSQKLRYRLVFREEECEAVFPHIAWAAALKDWAGPKAGERPAAYIAIVSERPRDVDTGIAAVTLQYAAAERGLGACMLGAIKREAIKEVLGLGDEWNLLLLIALGKPAEKVVLEDASEGDDLRYYRDANDIHHVPKLRADDLII